MANQTIFKRYEIKYMLDANQLSMLKNEMKNYMIADEHGKSTICSLYFDTPQYLLIRRSMDHPMYKEKLRLRSYGVADKDTTVFVELKKKYDSVVYKRRVAMTEAYYAKDDHEFRVTFDQNILWWDYDLNLCSGIYGNPILKENQTLMEVKTAGAIPMWMVRFLRDNGIYKTSFSKYGTAYRTLYNASDNLLGIEAYGNRVNGYKEKTEKADGGLINYA